MKPAGSVKVEFEPILTQERKVIAHFSYGGNGHSQSSQNPQNLAELNGFLAFFQVHDEPTSRAGHSGQIILAQLLSFPCFPHDPAQSLQRFLSWCPYLVTVRYHLYGF